MKSDSKDKGKRGRAPDLSGRETEEAAKAAATTMFTLFLGFKFTYSNISAFNSNIHSWGDPS